MRKLIKEAFYRAMARILRPHFERFLENVEREVREEEEQERAHAKEECAECFFKDRCVDGHIIIGRPLFSMTPPFMEKPEEPS